MFTVAGVAAHPLVGAAAAAHPDVAHSRWRVRSSMFISVNLSGVAALQDGLGVTIFLSLATALLHRLT